jgi:hypothetical protein
VDPSHGDQRGEVDIKMVMATALRPAIIHLESASVQDHRGHPMMMAQATDDFADDPHDALVPARVDDVALPPVDHRGNELRDNIEESAASVIGRRHRTPR